MLKEEARERVLKELPSRFGIYDMLAMYKYISTKNILIDGGFNLDCSDRENVFIDIITKNDPEIIKLLESHLEMSDDIQNSATLIRNYDSFFGKLKTTDNIKDEVMQFLTKFN